MRRAVLALSILAIGAALLAVLTTMIDDRPAPRREPAPRQSFDRAPLAASLAAAGHRLGDAAHVRIYKQEARLELWLEAADGRYRLFRSYEICAFSGDLGPKFREGDRQAPEGFYKVRTAQLNPASRHHLAFNLGFPNEYDRQHGRTGSALMVHGGCSSVGCYAITDAHVDEVYAVVEAALRQGQDGVDVHVFPFAMSPDAVAAAEAADHPHADFWANLLEGHALFVRTGRPPGVAACNGRYVFDRRDAGCEPIMGWQA
ncbi:Murein L,D-transpeptidase YafK [Devosia enhydra]|uniref:Murein L,D-transpeptidase YafK n=1 Tax=Devosia enhydra TaxID=665118 RepID=A0A1K2I1Z6_9HYPH|nr:L,D-transpeptidase family protein [Devosia enhydra]SFZ85780.1 Murein L,D-transpeptidase YafK [Devosia enhydra]